MKYASITKMLTWYAICLSTPPANAKRFLDTVSPDIAVFVKYEFGQLFAGNSAAGNIPTYIISSIFRRGQIFFRPWGGIGSAECSTALRAFMFKMMLHGNCWHR